MRKDLITRKSYDLFFIKICILDQFEETRYKEKMLVEKVGVQTQTSSKDPFNLNSRRVVVGPNLYFRADGSPDPDPIHYWGSVNQMIFINILINWIRNGSLSNKLGTPKLLKALDITPDISMDLSALVEAYMPGM